jgi:hypothetical protein
MGAKAALAPVAGVDQGSAPYRYWWLAILLLSLGGWGLVIGTIMLIVSLV